MSKILITGGTGLIGKKLRKVLGKNHDVVILSRSPKKKNEFKWDLKNNYIDETVFKNLDYIIHLAGAGIADERWTNKRKQIIIDSRVETANLLFKKVKELNVQLKGFISASGISYYGATTSSKIYKESDNAGNDFIADVCIQWENAALQFNKLNIPVSILRTGIVLSNKGGALSKMLTPVISPLGNGKQYIAWIHIDDLCNMYNWLISTNTSGIYNAVANEHHNYTSFAKTLAKVTGKPYLGISVPSFLLKLAFGELAVILLEGSRISGEKWTETNFEFKFPKLTLALSNLFKT